MLFYNKGQRLKLLEMDDKGMTPFEATIMFDARAYIIWLLGSAHHTDGIYLIYDLDYYYFYMILLLMLTRIGPYYTVLELTYIYIYWLCDIKNL